MVGVLDWSLVTCRVTSKVRSPTQRQAAFRATCTTNSEIFGDSESSEQELSRLAMTTPVNEPSLSAFASMPRLLFKPSFAAPGVELADLCQRALQQPLQAACSQSKSTSLADGGLAYPVNVRYARKVAVSAM